MENRSKEEIRKSIEYAINKVRYDLDGFVETMLTRYNLEPEDKLFVLNLIKENNFLPVGRFYNNSPECIRIFLEEDTMPKYKIYYFTDYPDKDMSDDENRNEIINEIYDYVQKHKIIGCINDW